MWRISITALLVLAAHASDLQPLPTLSPSDPPPIRIFASAVPRLPWTVAGEHGALLGRQDGSFESWIWPVKILSRFRISADLKDYDVPIDVNALASTISVEPAETIITYSHAAFTIKQHAFSPRGIKNPASGAVVFFEIQSIRPLTLTFSFTPEVLRMWPAANYGRPDGEWVKTGQSGFYILHTDNPEFSGLVGMPGTQPGIQAPYQEHPQSYPLQLKLSFDPKLNAGQVFPLVMAVRDRTDPATQVNQVEQSIEKLYQATQSYYAHFFDSRTTVQTPNPQIDEAVRWAEVAIDQMQVKYGDETGMVAGYYESADSARPGYAWFFGRDTLWTTFAINSYGDFALTRTALDFLIHRQREDGKIMHEFSQSAAALDWTKTPYFYASADSTPLLVMAMWDYVRASGDASYLKQNWNAIRKAYEFERSHDSDGDGIYENTEGTGWVESWPPGMPHQEVYLAALDQQSCEAMSQLAAIMQDQALATTARSAAEKIGRTIEAEYLDPEQFYAFSRNANGSLDTTPSIYSAVAWWQGTYGLLKPGPMLSRWASPEFSTDWGTRDISGDSPYFDPISYHQGSVWPLFTGWVSLAEYRAGRDLSGYAHLMQNLRLTWLQDLGSTTELLSGDFYQPLGRSSSHQMWSSAMILAPLLKGLFGLQPDAMQHRLGITPHLPAEWDHASIHNISVGDQLVSVDIKRTAGSLRIQATTSKSGVLCLSTGPLPVSSCAEPAARVHTISVSVPAVEVSLPDEAPGQGDRTHAVKAIDQVYSDGQATFTLAAPGGTHASLFVRKNNPQVHCDDFPIANEHLAVQFPDGPGYKTVVIKFHW